jgi:hypothetical protein
VTHKLHRIETVIESLPSPQAAFRPGQARNTYLMDRSLMKDRLNDEGPKAGDLDRMLNFARRKTEP